ncbi:MAG: hypothetical protein E7549_04060 [Ruminococcaceae bacterium]|nr:hypothetical protein [Oscillospiraceae bacterium]
MRLKYVLAIVACISVIAVCATVITVTLVNRGAVTPDEGTVTTTTTEAQGPPALEILSATEAGEWVAVATTFGRFRYPVAMADLLRAEAVSEGTTAALRFVARLDGRDVTIYTIHYNKAVGIPCGTLVLSDTADEIAVYADLAEKPDDLSEEWVGTFYAAQETFNDVLSSMAEDSRFTRREGA